MTRPHVRSALPWLRSGPLFRVHSSAVAELDAFVEGSGYLRIDLDGRRMTSREAAHAELKRAFGLPEWCGASWDAFNDGFGHFVLEHDGALVAVVLHHLDELAGAAPATAVEVGWALLECKLGVMPSLAPTTSARIQLEVFVVGDGPDFDRPQ